MSRMTASALSPNSDAEKPLLSITASMRVGHGARLLVDFLLHEVAVRAELQRGERDVGNMHFALDRRAVGVEHLARCRA